MTGSESIRRSLPWLGVTFVSLVAATTAVGEPRQLVDERLGSLALAAFAAGAVFIIFANIGYPTLLAWPVLTGIAYPFVQYPPGGDAIVTFDRVWIVGLIGCVIRFRTSLEGAGRLFVASLGLVVLTFGARTIASPDFSISTLQLWLDALVLPATLTMATIAFAHDRLRSLEIAAAVMVGGTILALLGIAQRFAGLDLSGYSATALRLESTLGTFRISGPYPYPEPYALSLAICLGATLYWIQARVPQRRVLGSTFAAIQVAAIGLTLFRAAWIAAVLVVVASLGLRPRRMGRLTFVTVMVAALLAAATTQVKDTALFSERVENTDNIYGRLATWKQGLEIFGSEPIFGVGVNRYEVVASSLPETEVNGVSSVIFAHNSAIWVLAEQGIVGFAAFVLLGFSVWRMFRNLRLRGSPSDNQVLVGTAVGVVLGYLVMGLTLTMIPYGPSNAFLAIVLGLVAARFRPGFDSPEQGVSHAVDAPSRGPAVYRSGGAPDASPRR